MDKPLTQLGYEETSPGYKPMVPTGSVEENPIPTIDFMGALWRRKSVVILLAVVGVGVASLLYTQTTPTYSSVTRIMLWMQAPPSVINGEMIQQQVALEKQKTLLTSQTVLGYALTTGSMNELTSFVSSESPLGELKGMLSIMPVGKDMSSDALEIRCEGKHKDDLVPILHNVLNSYVLTLEKNSSDSGQESIDLIEKLQSQLAESQAGDKQKYYDLLKRLNLSAENDKGNWENPYVRELEMLKLQRDEFVKAFREADQSLVQVQKSLDPNRESDELLRLSVIEARKYFDLNGSGDNYSILAVEDRQRISRYEQRIEVAYAEVVQLEAEREEAAKRFGEKHPQVEFIESRYQAALASTKRLTDELDSRRTMNSDSDVKVKMNETAIQEAKGRDEELVRMYTAALLNQRERVKYNLEKSTEDIVRLTEESNKIAGAITDVNMLRDQIEERRISVDQILEKLSAMRVMSKDYTTTKVKVIDPPGIPFKVFPILTKFLLVGTLLGGLAGAGLAVLIDHSDLSYRTPIDIQESLNVPVLCKVPKIRKGKIEKDFTGSPMLVAAINPSSSAAETFRAARTSLLFAAGQTGHKVFMFTSPSPGDGKSTTVANLAISLAQTNKRVCLVDADYRRPRVQQNFGVQFEPGGMQYLLGEASLDQVLRPCVFQSNLTLMTTGGRPKNPGELVASSAFADMVGELRSRFDIVLIDSPPVIPVADATSLCSVVDGIILILRIRRGVILSAHKAKERLDLVQGNLMGVVVNGMDENLYYNEYGTYYRGSYYYGSSYARSYDKEYSDYSDKVRDRGEKRTAGKS